MSRIDLFLDDALAGVDFRESNPRAPISRAYPWGATIASRLARSLSVMTLKDAERQVWL
jgi:hypothetical protein